MKFDKNSLGARMKRYELTYKQQLIKRLPIIIRVDGKAFHTWTKYINTLNDPSLKTSPFSENLHGSMSYAASYLMKDMQGVQLAYLQSDEVSFLLRDWDTITTEQWFDGSVHKIVSNSASVFTGGFIQSLYRSAGMNLLWNWINTQHLIVECFSCLKKMYVITLSGDSKTQHVIVSICWDNITSLTSNYRKNQPVTCRICLCKNWVLTGTICLYGKNEDQPSLDVSRSLLKKIRQYLQPIETTLNNYLSYE